MATARFVDKGRRLVGFSAEFVVKCPRCGTAAKVVRAWDYERRFWLLATVTCAACGFSRRQEPPVAGPVGPRDHWPRAPVGWVGPVTIRAWCRCRACGRRMETTRRAKAWPQSRLVALTCDGCGTVTETEFDVYPVTVPHALVDSCFGLPLWLQTPCAGHVLWAYNAGHLAYLKGFIQADLRERRGTYHRSVVSRLPGWLKQAKHRDEALRAVARLERQLVEGR